MIVQDRYSISSYEKKSELFSLSPSAKFILYIIKQQGPLERTKIIKMTLLPKRTIAYALKDLQEHDFIYKRKSEKDKRKSIYEALI